MKALVLGASNSLKHNGWTAGFAECGIEVINLSCGASSGIQFASMIHHDFSVYDYVFFESLCNDEDDYLNFQLYESVELLRDIYYELFSTISAQSCLIVLNVPLLRTLDKRSYLKNKASPIYKLRNWLGNAVGAQVINVEDVLKFYAVALGLDHHHYLFEDPPHPAFPMMRELGKLIGQRLAIMTPEDRAVLFRHNTRQYADNYVLVCPSELAPCDTVRISNNLIQEDFQALAGSSIDLQSYASYRLIGCYILFMNLKRYLAFDTAQGTSTLLIGYAPERVGQINRVFMATPNVMCVHTLRLLTPVGKADREHLLTGWRRFMTPKPPEQDDPRESDRLLLQSLVFRKQDLLHDRAAWQNLDFDESVLAGVLIRQLMDEQVFKATPFAQLTLKAFDGSSLFFDLQANKCALLPSQLVSTDPRSLVAVQVSEHSTGELTFYVLEHGCSRQLQMGRYGLERAALDAGSDTGPEFYAEHHGDRFLVRYQQHYMRALLAHPYHGVAFDAPAINDWSLFRYE